MNVRSSHVVALLSIFFLASACTKKNFGRRPVNKAVHHNPSIDAANGSDAGANGIDPEKAEEMVRASALIWKRYRAFEQGLMAGLELGKDQLCMEAGQYSCVDKVHLTALGGNEPFDNAQHERPERPSVLTPVAVERILLAACSERARLDQQAGPSAARVFKHFDLNGAAATAEQIKPQVTELYQRLLARDPSDAELSMAATAADKFSSAANLAIGLCFAVGTSAENIFL